MENPQQPRTNELVESLTPCSLRSIATVLGRDHVAIAEEVMERIGATGIYLPVGSAENPSDSHPISDRVYVGAAGRRLRAQTTRF